MAFTIREYRDEDRSALEALMEELQGHLVQIDPLKRQRRVPEYGRKYVDDLFKKIQNGDGKICIAEDQGAVVGCSACVIITLREEDLLSVQPLSEGRILELVVLPHARGKGIGTALMHAAEEYLRSKGCSAARIQAFAPNKNARSLYEKLGYTERVVDLVKAW